jgi:hypothetical protein
MADKELNAQVDDRILEILRIVIQRSWENRREDQVARALVFLLVRVGNSWRSLRTLATHTGDIEGFAVDAGAILRAMFDAYLQADYIVSNCDEASARASDYFEFEHVERYKHMTKWLNHNNALVNTVKTSPRRAEGERNVRQQYDRVKDRFYVDRVLKDGTVKRGPKTRSQWFPGDLRKIADQLGKADEYDILLASLHGCVHSSAYALANGPAIPPEHVVSWGATISARVAYLNLKHNKISLDDSSDRILGSLNRPYFLPWELARDGSETR